MVLIEEISINTIFYKKVKSLKFFLLKFNFIKVSLNIQDNNISFLEEDYYKIIQKNIIF